MAIDGSSDGAGWRLRMEQGSDVMAVRFSSDGALVGAACADGWVRCYDAHTGTASYASHALAQCLKWGTHEDRGEPSQAHTSRVQAVKWSPADPHQIVTAGWDRTIQVWDTRTDQATGSLYGAYVCGDAVDLHVDGRTLLTGSARDGEQLQLWDLAALHKPAEVLPLPPRGGEAGRGWGGVYAAQFRPSAGAAFAAGGIAGVCIGDAAGRGPLMAPSAFLPPDFRSVFGFRAHEHGVGGEGPALAPALRRQSACDCLTPSPSRTTT
eukprot:gene16682-38280_t